MRTNRNIWLLCSAALLAAPLVLTPTAPADAQGKPPPAGGAPGGVQEGPTARRLPGKPPPLEATPLPPPPGGGQRQPPEASLPPPASGGPGKPPPASPGAPPTPPGGGRQVSSGTGFVVGARRLLTNHHVANGCTEMRARTSTGQELSARMIVSDEQRDLALLSVEGDVGPVLYFRDGPDLRRGDALVTYGFPLAGLLSSGPTLTTGDISALAGLRDDQRQFQMSAPIQPGNSGGPVLDLGGHVIGIAVSKLNAQRIAQATGDIPQNVNFAVKGTEAVAFLRQNNLTPQMAPTNGPLHNAAEVGEIAHPSTVLLRCLR